MKEEFFHGSPIRFDTPVRENQCVTNSKRNALIFARRKCQGECYIYRLLLDPATDWKLSEEGGLRNKGLVRATPFLERITVTEDLIRQCKSDGTGDVQRVLGIDRSFQGKFSGVTPQQTS